MDDNVIMPDPLAFFITWTTYGTWLPGDDRGWVENRHGWQLPNPDLERHCRAGMTEKQCLLSQKEREIVQRQILETCKHRVWRLIVSACRSNHVHLVIGVADCHPNKMRDDIKAWSTRRLREQSRPSQKHWWAERGSNRYIWNEESLTTVVQYVTEAQDRKGLDALR